MDRLTYYKEHNINLNGETYLITGDTYSIRTHLKELGCSYDKFLGWHSDKDLPTLSCIKINVEDYLVWDIGLDMLVPKSGAEAAIKNIINPPKPLQYEYFPDDEINNLVVKLIARSEFTNKFGLQHRYALVDLDEKYFFIWFTKSNIICKADDLIYIQHAFIKETQEFNGKRCTIIKNLKWESEF